MESILKNLLRESFGLDDRYTSWIYEEDINDPNSFIFKVAVCCAIDSNKADWCIIAIGTQRDSRSEPEAIGTIRFRRGENDDPGSVIRRATILLERADILFENIIS